MSLIITLFNIIITLACLHTALGYEMAHRTVKKSCESFVAHEDRHVDNWSDVYGNWTAYYVYNWWELEPQVCIQLEFKRPKRETIQSFEASLDKEIRITPHLRNSSLHLVMSPGTRELLVFNGARPGLVYGVPKHLTASMEMMRDSDELPKLHFALKTVLDERYLLVMDCADSTVTLSARADAPPDLDAMGKLADEVDFGSPHEVCLQTSTAPPNFFG